MNVSFANTKIQIAGETVNDLLVLKEFITDNIRHSPLLYFEIKTDTFVPQMIITIGGYDAAYEVAGCIKRWFNK